MELQLTKVLLNTTITKLNVLLIRTENVNETNYNALSLYIFLDYLMKQFKYQQCKNMLLNYLKLYFFLYIPIFLITE